VRHTYIHTYIQTDRQTDRQTDVLFEKYIYMKSQLRIIKSLRAEQKLSLKNI